MPDQLMERVEPMQVRISSRHVDLDAALEDHITERLEKLSRFVEGLDSAEVHFEEDRHHKNYELKNVCEITLAGHGHHVRTKMAAPDAQTAFDKAVPRLERQLRKLKTKMLKRNHGNGESIRHEAPADILETEEGPRIVKTKQFEMEPMTPDEAVLQMELVGHDFYFFQNADTGRSAVVYLRADGDVGLIDHAD